MFRKHPMSFCNEFPELHERGLSVKPQKNLNLVGANNHSALQQNTISNHSTIITIVGADLCVCPNMMLSMLPKM
jgi:hypothetical protein